MSSPNTPSAFKRIFVGPGADYAQSGAEADIARFAGESGDILTVSESVFGEGDYVEINGHLRQKGGGVYDVKAFDAKGDGVTDDTAAIQAAIDAAAATTYGCVVYFPPGRYRVTSPGLVLTANTYLEGAGYNISIIIKDESNADFIGSVHNQSTWPAYYPIEHISIRNLGFEGTGETDRTQATWSMTRISADHVTVTGCAFSYSRAIGLFVEQSKRVVVTNNRVYRSLADGIGVWSSSEVIIANNEVIGSNDDCISVHYSDYLDAPVASNVMIVNNVITESQGINVVNMRSFIVSNNILTRSMAVAIRVVANPDEAAVFAGRVSGNVITDVIRRDEPNPGMQAHVGILITGGVPNAATGSGIPGEPTSGTGTVTSLYGSNEPGTLYQPSTGVDYGRPPAFGIDVSNNVLVRSLPAVTTVSQWGYGADGLWVADNGDGTGFYNGAVVDAALRFTGIGLDAAVRNCRIERNYIQCGGPVGIDFRTANTVADRNFSGVQIVGNKIFDFATYGIRLPQNATNHRIMVQDNEIDGDPLFRHSNRGSNGTWLNATSPIGIYSDTSAGALIERNHFRNLATTVTGTASTKFITFRDNYVYGNYAGLNFNTGNKGSGTIPATGVRGWILIAEDSDPTSATYGQISSDVVFASSSMPSTGTYVRGHFVSNTNPVQSGGKVLLGWARLTTGSAHVLNTDWSALYATTT